MMDGLDDVTLPPHLQQCLREWKIDALTAVQKMAVNKGVANGESAIVCAPTSSGKTLVGELALANALHDGLDCLYLVSHRALAEQKFADFARRFAAAQWKSSVSVGISTGDHEEGDVGCRLLISTYEKALGLLLAGRLKVDKTIIVADELQLLGDSGRGASVETLCALLRQQSPRQFVGLTATVENPQELADWLNCKCVRCPTRDVELLQTIRYGGKLHTVPFGQEEGETSKDVYQHADLFGIIQKTIQDGLGPVLVFTETRREAAECAQTYALRCQRAAAGLEISQQLDLFSEPTESSTNLKSHAERLVTFHSADLTPDERSIIEAGFADRRFDVCFATSTLAAGVNFPFRTVIIPKLRYDYRKPAGRLFDRSEYRNMSGRAGRLGLHEDGRVILLPTTEAELRHSNTLVSPENDHVESQLVNLSMRRTVLSLVSARAVTSKEQLQTFFDNTFYRHVLAEKNPNKLESLVSTASQAVDWLTGNGFLEESHSTLLPTPLGKSTALSGLLPETAKSFIDLLKDHSGTLIDSFQDHEIALVHWAVVSPEYVGTYPSRFLPYPSGKPKPESSQFVSRAPLLTAWDRTDSIPTRCVHAIGLFIQGEAERKIRFATGLSSGQVHRLAQDLSWIMEGLSRISGASDLGYPQTLTNQLAMLSRRIRWGTPAEAIDLLRIAGRHHVPGFRRQRVMALIANGITSVAGVLTASKEWLAKLLGGEARTDALLSALADRFDPNTVSYDRIHLDLARELGIEAKIAACNETLGTEYEDAIHSLLQEETSWIVQKLDDGIRQNVPDLLLSMGEIELLIECKTVTKKPPLIAKEEAFAVIQKAVDFDGKMRRVTLGKPDFDEHSKKKASAASTITLVCHTVFMEGLMRVLTGRLSAHQFIRWLAEPGITELTRLPGTPTYTEPDAD